MYFNVLHRAALYSAGNTLYNPIRALLQAKWLCDCVWVLALGSQRLAKFIKKRSVREISCAAEKGNWCWTNNSVFAVHSLQPTHSTLNTHCFPHLTSPHFTSLHLSPNPQRASETLRWNLCSVKQNTESVLTVCRTLCGNHDITETGRIPVQTMVILCFFAV